MKLTLKKLIIIAFTLVAGYFVFKYFSETQNFTFYCPQDLKVCPDGTYVGRVPPRCEFGPCPESNISADSWNSFIDGETSVSFKYPDRLSTKYITAVDWPPQVQVLEEPFECVNAGSETDRAGATRQITNNERTYCATKIAEGVAGSIYTQYAYASQINEKTVILTFSTRSDKCENYSKTEKTECETEREEFDVDNFIDRLFSTIVFTQ